MYEALHNGKATIVISSCGLVVVGPHTNGGKTTLNYALTGDKRPPKNRRDMKVKARWIYANHMNSWKGVEGLETIAEIVNCSEYEPFDDTMVFGHHKQTKKYGRKSDQYVWLEYNLQAIISGILLQMRDRQKLPGMSRKVVIHTLDCESHPIFDSEILPTILGWKTLVLVVFDGSTIDTHEVMTNPLSADAMAYFHKQMCCIHAQMLRRSSSSNTLDQAKMQVIVVCTHGDMLNEEVKQRVKEQLETSCKNKQYQSLLLDTYVVDCTLAGQCNEDLSLKQLRTRIYKHAIKFEEKTPVSWFLFQQLMKKFVDTWGPIAKLEEIEEVAHICKIPQQDIRRVLEYHHKLGVLLHYPQIDGLDDIVIMDPQWLINQISKLIVPPEQCSSQQLLKDFQEKGILLEDLCKEIWYGIEDKVTPGALMELLVHFNLAACVRNVSNVCLNLYRREEYFIGWVLPKCPANIEDGLKKCFLRAAPLYIAFTTQYVPPGYFTHIITAMSQWCSKCSVLMFRPLYRNRITIVYGQVDEITITEWCNSIKVDLVRVKPKYKKEDLEDNNFRNTCEAVLTLLQNSILVVEQWIPSIGTSFALSCPASEPKCEGSLHLALLETPGELVGEADEIHKYIRCKNTGFLYEPTAQQQYWINPGRVCSCKICSYLFTNLP